MKEEKIAIQYLEQIGVDWKPSFTHEQWLQRFRPIPAENLK